MLAVGVWACGPAAVDVQTTFARALKPVELRAASTATTADPLFLRVRAYADSGYRAHADDWRDRIEQQVRRATAVLEGEFGVRLELESVRSWDRTRTDVEIRDALDELVRADPSFDVDWVVGFVGPLPEDRSASYDILGIARPFGRHLVVRAMQTSGDLERIDEWYDELSPEDRSAFARARRVHRETAVFLHEWAHTLGAVHECDSSWIMSKRYGILESRFSPESGQLVRIGLAHRDLSVRHAFSLWHADYASATSRMMKAWFDCPMLEKDLALHRNLLRAASSAFGPHDAAPGGHAARERWWGEVRGVIAPRLEALGARLPRPQPGRRGQHRAAAVRVRVAPSGAPTNASLLFSSGYGALDDGVLEAFREAAPLPRPPGMREDAEFEFVYGYGKEL